MMIFSNVHTVSSYNIVRNSYIVVRSKRQNAGPWDISLLNEKEYKKGKRKIRPDILLFQ